ncbi:hypothetical protein [Larkinella arboricola]
MIKLTALHLQQLDQALVRSGLPQVLHPELLDHLAIDIEHAMADGQDFSAALHQVMQQVNAEAIAQLKQIDQQMQDRAVVPAFVNRVPVRRYRKRHRATDQFKIWRQTSVLAFVTLMICLFWMSPVFCIPLTAFGSVCIVALTSLLGALGARLFTPRRSRGIRLQAA